MWARYFSPDKQPQKPKEKKCQHQTHDDGRDIDMRGSLIATYEETLIDRCTKAFYEIPLRNSGGVDIGWTSLEAHMPRHGDGEEPDDW